MTQTWKTVRVFISSTFRDMQAERDHLVRFVFPRLREELLQRRIHFVDVDLRWGVTSEQNASEVCREIIDHCRPRFICMLGGHYGSVPPGKDHSITADEVHYGVLDRMLNDRGFSYFYFREEAATATMVETTTAEFREPQGSDNLNKLIKLKQTIIDAGLNPFFYPAQWDNGSKRLTGLKKFGDRVYEDLLESMKSDPELRDRFVSDMVAQLDEFTEESAAMEAFVEERNERFVLGSRRAVLVELLAHAIAPGSSGYICLTGAPGSGKSALLAHLSTHPLISQPSTLLIRHFVGASPASTDVRRTLRRLCHELKAGSSEITADIPNDSEKLRVTFTNFLQKACVHRRVVILLDAVNQFDLASNFAGLHWLPEELPPNVLIILSSLDGPTLEELRRCSCKLREIELRPLTEEDGEAIIEQFHKSYHKKFEPDQRVSLLAKTEASTPLYLLAALEELRTLGTRKEITMRISEMPPTTHELFVWILERLEKDDGFRDAAGQHVGHELVSRFVALLGASRYGLNQRELSELLAPGEAKADTPIEPDPQGNVAALLHLLRPYLMRRGELLDFYHDQFREAAKEAWLKTDVQRHAACEQLAKYFNQAPFERRLDEYPYQLQHAKEWNSLATALSDLDFFEYAWDKGRKYEWMAYWESLKESYDPADCYQKVIDKRLNGTEKTVEIARSMNKIGKLLSGMSFFNPALSMFENSFAILKTLLGSDHPEVAALLYNIARAYDRQYGESKAELVVQYYNDVYENYMKLGMLLDASEVKIESANFKRRALKKLKEAKKDCEEAKKTLESMNENNYRYKLLYAQCLNILGLIYSGLEEPELVKQCQNLFQQSINYKKEVGDLDSIGESENAMGLFLRNTANRDFNKINEAIDHLKIALEIRKSIGNYRGAAQSCRNLGLCYTDRIAFIENVEEKEESYQLAKQSYLNGINYWNKRKGKLPIEELLEFKYRLGELEINQGNKKEGINILQEVQEERNRIGDWHNRARALDLLLKAYRGTKDSKVTAHKIITIYQNVLADKTKIKQIYEEPVRFKNAKDFLKRIIKEVPECEGISSKILEDISKIFDENRG